MANDNIQEKFKSMQFSINNPEQVLEMFKEDGSLNVDLLQELRDLALSLPTYENNQHRFDEFQDTNTKVSDNEIRAALATCDKDVSAYALAEKIVATSNNKYQKIEPIKKAEELDENPLNYDYAIQKPIIRITGVIIGFHNIYKTPTTPVPSRSMYLLHTHKTKNGIIDISWVPVSLRMSTQSMIPLTKLAHKLIPLKTPVSVVCHKNSIQRYLEVMDIQTLTAPVKAEEVIVPQEQEVTGLI